MRRVLLPSLIALFDNRRTIFTFSAFALKVATILVTAFYFVRWIFNWAALFGATNAVTYLLLGVGLFWRYGVGSGSRIASNRRLLQSHLNTAGAILRGQFC